MKSPRPPQSHNRGSSSNPLNNTRANQDAETPRELEDPADRIYAELYPSEPRDSLPYPIKPSHRVYHRKSELRTAANAGPCNTRGGDGAGPSTSSSFGSKLAEAHMRSGRVEMMLGMHVLRCLELVGELSSEARARMNVHATHAREDIDYCDVERALQNSRAATTDAQHPGSSTRKHGGGEIAPNAKALGSCPTCGSKVDGENLTPPAGGSSDIAGVAQRFNQAEIRQVGIAFGADPSALRPAVSRMWLSARGSKPDISSIVGSGPSIASLFLG